MFKFPAQSFRHTIFVRLVLTYLVVILPIISLGVYLYNWSYRIASQDLSRATLAQLSFYLEDLNREIEWLEIQQFDILEDSELNKLAVTWDMMDSVDKKASMDYLLHRLVSFKNSSAYMKDVYVHIRSIHKTISAINRIDTLDLVRYDHFRSITHGKENRLSRLDDSLYLSASKQSGKKGTEPLFMVQIELDSDKLKQSLQQIRLYPESGSFIYSETSGFTLASDSDSNRIMHNYFREASGTGGNTFIMKSDGKKYHIDKADSEPLGLTVATILPEKSLRKPLNKFEMWAWLFSVASFFAVVIYAYSTYKYVHKPLLLFVQSFRRMEGGTLNIQIQHNRKDEIGYLYQRFNQMLTNLQTLIEQDFKQKLMMQRAELKQLQSQINPHFLYNSFFILNSLAKTGDVERIEQFTNMLGEYFRFITRNGQDTVYLSEEVKHSRTYTEIQKLRFSRRILVQFDDLPKEMEQIRVPRLIIQPIIENAYEHSLERMTEEGKLRVGFGMDSGEVRIVVEDNGEIPDSEIEALRNRLEHAPDAQEMTGLINIHRRLLLTYGEGSGLDLARGGMNGLQVVIRIKLREENGIV
ncbi:HAMP domain-containing protein [Cohnella sp. CFH 77786]|uniref:sensor histidine kinase n=1 Tax=Cohnella sp. CFH 77786 TaxID=2662265 RepID=UPI001C608B28|nr:histidine kinase [Cohnella sp. CFH 77786]MBW5445227.1 HAMP domain-containing protein [Cohnella sp. CFH 77786]